MKGKVLKGKLLIKQDDAVEKTAGGIYIPNVDEHKPHRGTVIIAGDDKGQVQPGDRVYYSEQVGTTFVLDEIEFDLQGEYVLVDEAQVLFIKKQ